MLVFSKVQGLAVTAFVLKPLFSCFILHAFARFLMDLLIGSMDEEGIGSVVAAPFAETPDNMPHCEGKCAEMWKIFEELSSMPTRSCSTKSEVKCPVSEDRGLQWAVDSEPTSSQYQYLSKQHSNHQLWRRCIPLGQLASALHWPRPECSSHLSHARLAHGFQRSCLVAAITFLHAALKLLFA